MAVLVACLLAVGAPALAGGDRDHEEALEAVRSGAALPLRRILDIAESQFDGEMLEAELEREGAIWIYQIEMISPRGSVFKLHYGAADGALLDGRGHGLMRAYRGDPAILPEDLRRRHEHMVERLANGGPGGGPRPRRGGWWHRLWEGAEDADRGPPPGGGGGGGGRWGDD
jgi:hypothetical protein